MSITQDELLRLMAVTLAGFVIGQSLYQLTSGKRDLGRVASRAWDGAVAFAVLYLFAAKRI
jgi:hypothetical protein